MGLIEVPRLQLIVSFDLRTSPQPKFQQFRLNIVVITLHSPMIKQEINIFVMKKKECNFIVLQYVVTSFTNIKVTYISFYLQDKYSYIASMQVKWPKFHGILKLCRRLIYYIISFPSQNNFTRKRKMETQRTRSTYIITVY